MKRPRILVAAVACAAVTFGSYGVVVASAGSSVTATTGVNIRLRPSTSSAIIGGLSRGQSLPKTGTSGSWTKVKFSGRTAFVYSRYLSAKRTSPAPTAKQFTTANLNFRTGAGLKYRIVATIPKGTEVALTGKTLSGFGQGIYHGDTGWLSLNYLSDRGTSVRAISTKVATTALLVRTTADANYRVLSVVPRGTRLSVTGVVSNGRAQVLISGALRWVTARYLTDSLAASGVERGLQPDAIRVLHAMQARYPEVKRYYGVRPDSLADHPSGRAVDAMLPGYPSRSASALGDRIADWAATNARAYNIRYVIYNQRIWSVARAREGWRPMSNRGSASANHKNHVHISVNP